MPFFRSERKKSAFSLVEVLIAITLGTVVAAALFSAFIFVARSTLSLANYAEMNSESGMGLEIFGRDARSADNIHVGFSSTEFTIEIPTGDGAEPEEIRYRYLENHPERPLMRRDSSGEEAIMTGIQKLNFNYYDLQAEEVSVPVGVKQIQLQLTLVREVVALENTEKVISARFILRNKKVSN